LQVAYSGYGAWPDGAILPQLRQYLYFCTSKASKLTNAAYGARPDGAILPQLRQYLYFCTSKASKTEYLPCHRDVYQACSREMPGESERQRRHL
jgi:ribosomal protein L24E